MGSTLLAHRLFSCPPVPSPSGRGVQPALADRRAPAQRGPVREGGQRVRADGTLQPTQKLKAILANPTIRRFLIHYLSFEPSKPIRMLWNTAYNGALKHINYHGFPNLRWLVVTVVSGQ